LFFHGTGLVLEQPIVFRELCVDNSLQKQFRGVFTALVHHAPGSDFGGCRLWPLSLWRRGDQAGQEQTAETCRFF
jgi:hypothetical protein